MKLAARALPLAVLALAVAGAARGEIYRWTDAEGRLHFTQHLDQVPPEQREAARRGAGTASSARVQTYSGTTDGAAPQAARPRRSRAVALRSRSPSCARAG